MDTKKYIEMSEDKKWWKNKKGFADEVNDVPLCLNKTNTVKNSDFVELNNALDKLVYEFILTHEIPNGWHLDYEIDNLEYLKKYGVECPMCDGCLTIFDENKEAIICSM